jgi:flagellar biosynthesis protein FlhF
MQVKKYEASSIIEALKEVKSDLGPDAIILSTQEAKRSVSGAKKFIVVAAVSESQLKKKELAAQQLGKVFESKVMNQSANRQRMFIENVYQGAEKKYNERNRRITSTPYIDIDDSQRAEELPPMPPTPAQEVSRESNVARVKQAARDAFQSSLQSQFFQEKKKQKEELLPDEILEAVKQKSVQPASALDDRIKRLKRVGVESELARRWAQDCQREIGSGQQKKSLVDSWYAKKILNSTSISNESATVEFFVGPHGSGKTSALVKMATHLVVQENQRVALVTTDLNKVGAVEQLRVYSRILNVPVFVMADYKEMSQKINSLQGYDKILVDTPGISLSNINELDFMRAIANADLEVSHRTHLVISALTKENDLGGVLKRFRVANFDDIIVSNIDQTSQHGILLNIQDKSSVPFHSFGIGSDIVDGFEPASRERVLDLVFKLTQKNGDRGNDSRI